jgi:hypothetical protein
VSPQALKLLPEIDWNRDTCWQPGAAGAWKSMQRFLDTGLRDTRAGARTKQNSPAHQSLTQTAAYGPA